MAKINTIPSFKSEGNIRGIPYRTIGLAIALTVPIAFLINIRLQGLPWALASIFVLWIMLKVAEVLTQRIPQDYVTHLLDWLRAGDMLYATHDARPVPLTIDPTLNYHEAQEREAAAVKRMQEEYVVYTSPE